MPSKVQSFEVLSLGLPIAAGGSAGSTHVSTVTHPHPCHRNFTQVHTVKPLDGESTEWASQKMLAESNRDDKPEDMGQSGEMEAP